MSDEVIIRQCAPTLAGIKTGSLFPYSYENKQKMVNDIRSFNRRYVCKGLCMLPMRYQEGRALLLLFRPEKLAEDLSKPVAASILSECGYSCESYNQYLVKLTRRFSECSVFPHEIGLFIGYPPEDVRGFITHKAQNFKCCGLWKVYGDEDKAKELFRQFNECTECYCSLWESGKKLEQLAVTA